MYLFRSLLIVVLSFVTALVQIPQSHKSEEKKKDLMAPYDFEGVVRSYPDSTFPLSAYKQAIYEARQQEAFLRNSSSMSYPWTLEGPTNIGGRINCLWQDPIIPTTFYAGSAVGGVWKTTNDCQSWFPVSDIFSQLAVSDVKTSPINHNVVYAATGDKNIGGYMFVGNGLFRSNDAGATWNNIGLQNTGIVAEIVLHPVDSNVIYAACMGYPFNPGPDRGVYKSTDGGISWSKILFINDSTGVIDLVMDPFDPNTMYAATWNRIRNNSRSVVFGPDAGIWKSTNGGLTWNLLTNGLPTGDMSRIGLAVSGSTPNKVFAVYVNTSLDLEGVYTSSNGGVSWSAINTTPLTGGVMGGFGWYFGRIEVNPTDDNEIWVCAVDMLKTNDNGNNWEFAWSTSDPHADKHDIIYLGGQKWLMATDGGIYRTQDDGITWVDADDIPNNQFYRITYNPMLPGEYAGGLQDNGTVIGNAANINGWNRIFGGDGFTILYHPIDPSIIYVEYQNGEINVSTDGGLSFFSATTGIDPNDRRNWDMPYVFNPQNPDEMLTGTYAAYINYSGSNVLWQIASSDLTDGIIYGPRFHTISAVDWSPLNDNHLLMGTSDGNVWFSGDQGVSWSQINAGLPDRYITSVHFSPNTLGKIFVTVSGYKDGINLPHIFRSDNNGLSWTAISGNLPPLAINDVYTLSGNDNVMFAATDGGVYASTNGGANWLRAGNNMPFVPVYDVDFEPVQRKLLAGTYGRSLYSINVDSLLTNQGLQLPQLNTQLKVYPTVFDNSISIEGATSAFNVMVYDMRGSVVRELVIQKENSVVDLSSLTAGVYLIRARSGASTGSWKVVKR
jgi:photosystem II stability/assembly factor-like uncharacterized protein